LRALRVGGGAFGVLASVDFYDELRIEADEIDHEAADWNLPLEFKMQETTIAKSGP
jgi:hypothetical protein